jgi:5-formyltetrahydrofolate cyclo-ligase
MSAAKEKEILRKKLLNKRLSLSAKEVKSYSDMILNMLSNYIDLENIKNIHIYSPIKNEVLTDAFIALARKDYPDINIETAPAKATISGVPEGRSYDLVILPVLGFDRRGCRLGYGGGYYDKLLARNEYNLAAGLAYSCQEAERIPEEPHDRKLQIIITEKEIIRPKDSS